MDVACCCDGSFVLPTVVMLKSLSDSLDGLEARVHVVVGACTGRQREILSVAGEFDGLEVVLYDAEDVVPVVFPECEQYPLSVYLKMYLPEMLGDEVSRVLYLDADVVIMDSPAELFRTNLEGHMLMAAPELSGPIQFASSKNGIKNRVEMGIPDDSMMFNSGVMLIDLAMWRESGVVGVIESYCIQHSGDVRLFDQEILNTFLWNRWKRMGLEWNLATDFFTREGWLRDELDVSEWERIRRNAKVLHFTKVPKPWVGVSLHPDANIWWETCNSLPDELVDECLRGYVSPQPVHPGESGLRVEEMVAMGRAS